MAIRLTPERYDVPILAVLAPLIWVVGCLIVWSMGCKTDVPVEVTGVDLSKNTTTTTTVPVSIEDVQGDVTVITLAGATPWTIAGLVGLLGLFQARRQSTAVRLIDRMAGAIEDVQKGQVTVDPRMGKIAALKKHIRGWGSPKPDRLERLLQSRLARMVKK
ncbi:hypothetical protein LCGC14_1893210 [marine sediment metagenome]|uniref:Uncharacterized protein n=1 Tax=marine sediment metagenome TaxID=412755 RepID=A0A0F9FYT6_9ZZZZ